MKIKLLFLLFGMSLAARADLVVNIAAPKTVGQKTVVKLDLKNTFPEKIESARAAIFLLDEHGQMIGQSTKWVIGGTKSNPALDVGKEIPFNFVVQTQRSVSATNLTSKITFNRIVLEGGKLADPNKQVQINHP
jgi:hypothetical protein